MSMPLLSDYRYVLVPRRMTDARFWHIYFQLTASRLAPFKPSAAQAAADHAAAAAAAAAAVEVESDDEPASSRPLAGHEGLSAGPVANPAYVAVEETSGGEAHAASPAAGGEATRDPQPAQGEEAASDLDAYLVDMLAGAGGPQGVDGEGSAEDEDEGAAELDLADLDELLRSGVEDSGASQPHHQHAG